MDIQGGLAAAASAIGIVKELRDIERSADEATFKLKIAELSAVLADTKLALIDAQVEIRGLKDSLDEMKNGKICPKCRNGRLQLVSSKTAAPFRGGVYGVEERLYKCSDEHCDFRTNEMFDPQGILKELIRKRK